MDQTALISFLILGELDVVAEFKCALVIRPVYPCLLSIDRYIIALDSDLIADHRAYCIVCIYVDECSAYSALCRSACLDTCRTDSILALVRREDGDIATGLGHDIGVRSDRYFCICCGIQNRDRTGHCEIGSAR